MGWGDWRGAREYGERYNFPYSGVWAEIRPPEEFALRMVSSDTINIPNRVLLQCTFGEKWTHWGTFTRRCLNEALFTIFDTSYICGVHELTI